MTPSATNTQGLTRSSGRPKQIDRQKVAVLALELFERDGFEQVTMEDVARAATISRRTLFREFPSKGDLVWEGMTQFVELARDWIETRRSTRAGISMRVLIEELIEPALVAAEGLDGIELARRQLRLIAENPGLLTHQALIEMRALFTAALTTGATTPDVRPPALVADALVAVGFSAALWWAAQDEGVTLIEAYRMAFGAMGDAAAQ